MSDDLSLVVGGRALLGWEDIAVTLRAEGFPNQFTVGLSSREPITSVETVARCGDTCQVKLGQDLVLTGFVDADVTSAAAQMHRIDIAGRGKCQDLADCSAEWDPASHGQIFGANALEVAKKIAAPYSIEVKQAPGSALGPAIPQFSLTYGQTAGEIIQAVSRSAALMAYEDSMGALVLAQVGTKEAASGVVYGQNVQAFSVSNTMNGRYSDYVCCMASQDLFGDLGEGGFFFDHETDDGVPRHRLLYHVLESAIEPQEFTTRKNKWERNRRLGRSTIVRATVDSWRDKDGTLWAPNTIVPVDLPGLRLADKKLILGEVTFKRSSEGTTADLMLMPKVAFTPEPISLLQASTADIPPDIGAPQ